MVFLLAFLLFVGFWCFLGGLVDIILYFLSDEVKDGLVLDTDPEEGMLEFNKGEADEVILRDEFALGEVFEDECSILGKEEGSEFKAMKELPPALEDHLIVMLLFGE
jgi:hypothetical protein